MSSDPETSSNNQELVCELLDKLCLDSLTLMEEEIQLKINMEKAMTDGESNLAKCRYIMGANSVSILNIPINSEVDVEPLMSVTSSCSEVNLGVENHLKSNGELESVDPVRWFGFLTPRYLAMSQSSYKDVLKWAIEAVNVQNHLKDLCTKVQSLRYLKSLNPSSIL